MRSVLFRSDSSRVNMRRRSVSPTGTLSSGLGVSSIANENIRAARLRRFCASSRLTTVERSRAQLCVCSRTAVAAAVNE